LSARPGSAAAVLTSLIATCKRHRIDSFERISAHPHSLLEHLLPDKWLNARSATTPAPHFLPPSHVCPASADAGSPDGYP